MLEVKVKFDSKGFEKKVRAEAVRVVENSNIECPHCKKSIPAVVGKSICSLCQKEVNVILD